MCTLKRFFFPVRHGGMAVETIDGTTVMFDCGSSSRRCLEDCLSYVKYYLAHTNGIFNGKPIIDCLFISHFDSDHINGLNYLKENFHIIRAVFPYVPEPYRPLVNLATKGMITKSMNFLSQNNIDIYSLTPQKNCLKLLTDQGDWTLNSKYNSWQWIAKSLFERRQWDSIKDKLQKNGIYIVSNKEYAQNGIENKDNKDKAIKVVLSSDWEEDCKNAQKEWDNPFTDFNLNEFDEIGKENCPEDEIKKHQDYNNEGLEKIDDNYRNTYNGDFYNENERLGRFSDAKRVINETIKDTFKKESSGSPSRAANEHGLLVLSKRKKDFCSCEFYPSQWYYPSRWHHPLHKIYKAKLSSCLYTGDTNIKNDKARIAIIDFMKVNKEPFLLFQIPHHGSANNSDYSTLKPIPSLFYFYYDSNTKRFYKNDISLHMPPWSVFRVDDLIINEIKVQ